MRVMTILGTRPEIIRLSRIIEKLDRLCQHTLVHTGQNFDPNLNDLFFEQLGVRRPDHFMGVRGDTFGKQVGEIIVESERILLEEKPDRVLILGDTNSGLAAFVAKRMGIAVYHLEAGNRCYDDRVPEEVNRRVIDHSSDILMPYTERSRANLLREGIEGRNIYVIGNPIWEVIKHYDSAINKSGIMQQLRVEAHRYFLVTMHRAENVDIEDRLHSLMTALELLQNKYGLPIICSLHPRTKSKLQRFGIDVTTNEQIQLHSPFGFFDFISLERNALCVLSDSGTVQEECSILRVANVTIRDVTERPETLECGSNMLSGADPTSILRCIHTVLEGGREWVIPPEYTVENVSGAVAKIVLGYRSASRFASAEQI